MNAISAMPAASIYEAAIRLAELRDRLIEIEEGDKPAENPDWDPVYDEVWRLGGEVMKMRPVTLQDAGTLALCISQHISELVELELPEEQARDFFYKIAKASAGILLALKNAGISLDLGPAEVDYEISRRKLPPGGEPDAELIRACTRAVATSREARAIMIAGTESPPGPDFDRISSLAEKRAKESRGFAIRIAKMPARTLAGVRARASVVRAIMPVDYAAGDTIPIDWHNGVLDALLRDLDAGRAI
jgi:hypothetical protein